MTGSVLIGVQWQAQRDTALVRCLESKAPSPLRSAGAEAAYNPANKKLKTTALESQYTAADAAVSAVAVARAPNKLAITDRESAFAGLRPLAVRSRNYLKASGAPKGVVDDAETFIRKIGRRSKVGKAKGRSQHA